MSFLPILYPATLLLLLLLVVRRSRRAAWIGAAITLALLALPIGVFRIHGAALLRRAGGGYAADQYEYARWCESEAGWIGNFLPWPGEPDIDAGFDWLLRAAMQKYPPALFALGARIKHDLLIPERMYGNGVARDPEQRGAQGQAMIDEAIGQGFRPRTDDVRFYPFEYRSDLPPAEGIRFAERIRAGR